MLCLIWWLYCKKELCLLCEGRVKNLWWKCVESVKRNTKHESPQMCQIRGTFVFFPVKQDDRKKRRDSTWYRQGYFTVTDRRVVVIVFLFFMYLMEMISVPFFFGVIVPFLDTGAMPFPEEAIMTFPDSRPGSVLIFIFRPVAASSFKLVRLSQ